MKLYIGKVIDSFVLGRLCYATKGTKRYIPEVLRVLACGEGDLCEEDEVDGHFDRLPDDGEDEEVEIEELEMAGEGERRLDFCFLRERSWLLDLFERSLLLPVAGLEDAVMKFNGMG